MTRFLKLRVHAILPSTVAFSSVHSVSSSIDMSDVGCSERNATFEGLSAAGGCGGGKSWRRGGETA